MPNLWVPVVEMTPTEVTVDVPEPDAVLKMPPSEAVMLPVETTVEFPEEPSL